MLAISSLWNSDMSHDNALPSAYLPPIWSYIPPQKSSMHFAEFNWCGYIENFEMFLSWMLRVQRISIIFCLPLRRWNPKPCKLLYYTHLADVRKGTGIRSPNSCRLLCNTARVLHLPPLSHLVSCTATCTLGITLQMLHSSPSLASVLLLCLSLVHSMLTWRHIFLGVSGISQHVP